GEILNRRQIITIAIRSYGCAAQVVIMSVFYVITFPVGNPFITKVIVRGLLPGGQVLFIVLVYIQDGFPCLGLDHPVAVAVVNKGCSARTEIGIMSPEFPSLIVER
ncbi:hypothetical protein DRO38_07555, partial [Candidatus Bathyarchaeota archaeon]